MPESLRQDIAFYGKLAALKIGYVAGQVELTSACGQRCRYCSSWKDHNTGRYRNQLPMDIVQKLLYDLNHLPYFEHLAFTGGDPQHWEESFSGLLVWMHKWKAERKFRTQVNTAMIVDIPTEFLRFWRYEIDDLRVSLDGVDREHYKFMRLVDIDPEEVLQRLERLHHPALSFNTTVSDKTIDHVPAILERLKRFRAPIRKAMFLPVLGYDHTPEFWKKWHAFYEDSSFSSEEYPFKLSFATDRIPPLGPSIRCHSGSISFHIKCNGDVFPCCLVGGEALSTVSELRLGNIYDEELDDIRRRYIPERHYGNPELPCSRICQFKQASINHAAEMASETILAMP